MHLCVYNGVLSMMNIELDRCNLYAYAWIEIRLLVTISTMCMWWWWWSFIMTYRIRMRTRISWIEESAESSIAKQRDEKAIEQPLSLWNEWHLQWCTLCIAQNLRTIKLTRIEFCDLTDNSISDSGQKPWIQIFVSHANKVIDRIYHFDWFSFIRFSTQLS